MYSLIEEYLVEAYIFISLYFSMLKEGLYIQLKWYKRMMYILQFKKVDQN